MVHHLPKPTEMDMRDARSFADIRAIVHEFERIAGSYDIEIRSGSELEAMCLELQDLEDKRTRRSPVPKGVDYRGSISRAMGLLYIIEFIVYLANNGRQLHPLIPHLRMLNDASVAQNVRTIGDDKANKLFELVIAMACMRFATQVMLDDPEHSQGNNPDIIFTYEGIRWGLACKVPNGESMISAYENIAKGVEQIDRSDVDRGLVVFNARNWINHDELWPKPGGDRIGLPQEKDIHWAWPNTDVVYEALHRLADKRWQMLRDVRCEETVEVFTQSAKAIPALLVFLQTSTTVATQFGPTFTRCGTYALCPVSGVDETTQRLTNKLNEATFRIPEIQQ